MGDVDKGVAPATLALPTWAQSALNGEGAHTPVSWRPKPGDVVAGEVVTRFTSRPTKFRPEGCPVLVLRVEAGTLAGEPLEAGAWAQVWCGTQTLHDFVNRESPQVGDKIAVRFHGKRDLPDGTRQNVFDVGRVPSAPEGW